MLEIAEDVHIEVSRKAVAQIVHDTSRRADEDRPPASSTPPSEESVDETKPTGWRRAAGGAETGAKIAPGNPAGSYPRTCAAVPPDLVLVVAL